LTRLDAGQVEKGGPMTNIQGDFGQNDSAPDVKKSADRSGSIKMPFISSWQTASDGVGVKIAAFSGQKRLAKGSSDLRDGNNLRKDFHRGPRRARSIKKTEEGAIARENGLKADEKQKRTPATRTQKRGEESNEHQHVVH